MGTNGLFTTFFNSHIVRWLNHYDSTNLVMFDGVWISVLTIGLSVPVCMLLTRWVPQLIGNPQIDGPILKAFPPPQFHFIREFFSGLSKKSGDIGE